VRRFSINLATRPFHNNTLYWAGFAAAALLLAGLTWYNSARASAISADLDEWSVRLEEHSAALSSLEREVRVMNSTVANLDLEDLGEKSTFANEIILSRLFSWTSLFDRLEEVLPPQVRLRSIRPSIGQGLIEVSVDGMTPDHGALLAFEDALDHSDYFTSVYPLHESTRVKEGEINFSVTFGYSPAGRVEEAPPAVEPTGGEPDSADAGVEEPGDAAAEARAGAAVQTGAAGELQRARPAAPAGAPGSSPRQGATDLSRRKAAGPARPGGTPGKAAGKAGRATTAPAPAPDDVDGDPNEEDPNDEDPNDEGEDGDGQGARP